MRFSLLHAADLRSDAISEQFNVVRIIVGCCNTQLLWIYEEAGHAKGVEMNKGRGPNAMNFILISKTRVFVPLFFYTDIFLTILANIMIFLKMQQNISTQNYKNNNFSSLLNGNRPR